MLIRGLFGCWFFVWGFFWGGFLSWRFFCISIVFIIVILFGIKFLFGSRIIWGDVFFWIVFLCISRLRDDFIVVFNWYSVIFYKLVFWWCFGCNVRDDGCYSWCYDERNE